METDDSGSVTTLHQAPSSVATHTAGGGRSEDDVIVDVVGDSSVSSNGAPRAKAAKSDAPPPPPATSDAEMKQTGKDSKQGDLPASVLLMHFNYVHEGENSESPSVFRNGGAPTCVTANSSSSPLDLLSEMRLRRAGGGTSSAGGLACAGPFPCAGSTSVPGTPGSSIGAGGDSAPCTPLAHLSLSPASLEMHPSRAIDCLDVHFSLEAGELLPLAICDRLKHGRHFTFLNANSPEHAITLVPPGVTDAMVSPDVPFVSRGPWLQIYLPNDFLEQLERQFSILQYPEEIVLPLVFRWPERRLRICVLDANSAQLPPVSFPPPMVPRPIPSSAPAFTPTSSLPPGLFPPGCVPPPPVLAAFINSQQGRGGDPLGSTSPPGSGASSSQSPPFVPPFPAAKPSPASASHLSAHSSSSSALMEAMLASFFSFYGNKMPFTGGFPASFPLQPPPPPSSNPSSMRPPW
uniref:SUFU_C domain-containing protein n=1 Tax=Mesocestoides corti TaxID=53468 RepID=A0A5K3FHF7_MESCO